MKRKEFSIISDTQGKLKHNLLSVLATLLVIGILIWSGPAQAVTLKLTFDTTTPPENTAITFTVAVDIAAGERIPISNLTLTIGPNSSNICVFNINGNIIGGPLCDSANINQVVQEYNEYGYGSNMYGYGYGYNYTGGGFGYWNQTYPPGYGYGYSASVPDELVYTVTWTTPSVNVNTDYTVRLDANANDGTVVYTYTNTETITVQQIALSLNSVSVLEADNFYSPYTGNNIVNLRVNVSGAVGVTANFSQLEGIDCGSGSDTINLAHQSADIWNGTCDVGTEAASKEFFGRSVIVIASDGFGAPQMNASQDIILYNLATPPSFSCTQQGEYTTNFTKVLDFANVNLVLDSKVNISCEMAQQGISLPAWAPAWTRDYTRMGMINFTSVDMSTQEKAQKVGDVSKYLTLSMTPPNQFGDSRIFINTSYLADLNTTAVIKLFHLPFTSQPTIEEDAGAAGVSGTAVWQQGAGIADSNLTFTVSGFSGYNITDSVIPNITISTPASGGIVSTPVAISVILNGTGSRIYSATINAGGTLYYYNSTINSAQCVNESIWSEKYTCTISQAMSNGANTVNVTAVDYGGTAGNSRAVVRSFTVDIVAPTTTVNATKISGGATYTNNTWLTSAHNISIGLLCSDTGGIGCNTTLYCTTSGCTPSTVWNVSSVSYHDEGISYFSYRSNDTFGNTEGVKEFIIKIDRTAPAINVTSPSADGSSSSTNINVAFNASDNYLDRCWWSEDGGASNTSLDSCSDSVAHNWGTGSHNVTIYANDSAGNLGSASRQFTKSASSSNTGGASSGSTFWTTTFAVDDLQQLIGGYTKPLAVGQRFRITLGGETHYIGILKIVGDVVTVQITSTPIEAKLKVGESAKVDVNNDGYYDLFVRLNSVLSGKADLTVMSIHEKIPAVVPEKKPVVQPKKEPEVCAPDWKCGEWSECVSGNKARICTDSNSCGVATGKPVESESCVKAKTPISGVAIIISILIVVVLCIVTMFYLQRRGETKY